ncbi:hypothetical protein E4U53_003072, partial [Claviceps sorghi]
SPGWGRVIPRAAKPVHRCEVSMDPEMRLTEPRDAKGVRGRRMLPRLPRAVETPTPGRVKQGAAWFRDVVPAFCLDHV